MNTILLSSDDIAAVARSVGVDALMSQLVARLQLAFGDGHEHSYEIPARSGFHYESPAPGLVEWMPLWQRGRRVMMKMVAYHPTNPSTKGVPTVLSTMSLFDTSSGHLEAMMDGTLPTALRTGAASSVASQLLAKPDSRILGIIGCGAQAVTQIHALSKAFRFEKILAFDIDETAACSLQERSAQFDLGNLAIEPATVDHVVANADILCTATSVEIGGGPVFPSEVPTKPWLHINAVGSDLPGKTEVPISFLKQATVVPDFLDQAKVEGECQQLAEDEVGASIVEVARCPEEFRHLQEKPTVFDSTGFALEDLAILELFLEHATDFGIGTAVGIESLSRDPRNPYAFLDTGATVARS